MATTQHRFCGCAGRCAGRAALSRATRSPCAPACAFSDTITPGNTDRDMRRSSCNLHPCVCCPTCLRVCAHARLPADAQCGHVSMCRSCTPDRPRAFRANANGTPSVQRHCRGRCGWTASAAAPRDCSSARPAFCCGTRKPLPLPLPLPCAGAQLAPHSTPVCAGGCRATLSWPALRAW